MSVYVTSLCVDFDIRMHEIEANRATAAPVIEVEWYSHPSYPREFRRLAEEQPIIDPRPPASASVSITTDTASPADELVAVSGGMVAWRVRVEVPEGVMSDTAVTLRLFDACLLYTSPSPRD